MKLLTITLSLLVLLISLSGCHHTAATQSQNNQNHSPSPTQSTTRTSQSDLIDINTAVKPDLEALPGIGEAYAQKIIDHRPYREKTDLVRLKVIPESTYKAIADKIIAHHTQ